MSGKYVTMPLSGKHVLLPSAGAPCEGGGKTARNEVLTIRVSAEEKEQLRAAADRFGVSLSDVTRDGVSSVLEGMQVGGVISMTVRTILALDLETVSGPDLREAFAQVIGQWDGLPFPPSEESVTHFDVPEATGRLAALVADQIILMRDSGALRFRGLPPSVAWRLVDQLFDLRSLHALAQPGHALFLRGDGKTTVMLVDVPRDPATSSAIMDYVRGLPDVAWPDPLPPSGCPFRQVSFSTLAHVVHDRVVLPLRHSLQWVHAGVLSAPPAAFS